MISRLIDRYFIRQPRLRRAVTRLLYGRRVQPVQLYGMTLQVHSLKENGYLRAARAAAHLSLFRDESAALLALATLVRDGMVFVDAGANVGVYSVMMSRYRHLYPRLRIVAFEVSPDTYERLALNAAAHGFQAHNLGLADKRARVEFVAGAVSHVTTRADLSNSYSIPGERFSAEVAPLDEIELGDGEVMLKIDVEGQEFAVLSGARRLFDAGRVRCVFLDGYTDPACWDFLAGHGFTLLDARQLTPATRATFHLLALRPEPPLAPTA